MKEEIRVTEEEIEKVLIALKKARTNTVTSSNDGKNNEIKQSNKQRERGGR